MAIFSLAGGEYAIDVEQVREIVRATGLVPVAGLPDDIAGLLERDGETVPVVDTCRHLGLPTAPRTVNTGVLVVELSTGVTGFLVDAVSTILRVSRRNVAPPVSVTALQRAPLRGFVQLDGRVVAMPDFERLLVGAVGSGGEGPLPVMLARGRHGLEAPRTPPRKLVTFEVGGNLYGMPIGEVAEIREPLPLMPLPFVPPHLLGLINLRGAILPVIDLRGVWGVPIPPDDPYSRLVILKGVGYQVALRADAVHDIARLPHTAFQPVPPGLAGAGPDCYTQVATIGDRMLVELNVAALLSATAPAKQRNEQ